MRQLILSMTPQTDWAKSGLSVRNRVQHNYRYQQLSSKTTNDIRRKLPSIFDLHLLHQVSLSVSRSTILKAETAYQHITNF